RLERGALPVDDALGVAVQIAAALEAAHGQGVVHRDLKPANVVITPAGQAKVLDFGLAKAMDSDSGASSDPSFSPTLTSTGTAAGMILGTAAYMSPEQARGKLVDRRADLWSFGCVLYECLTGEGLFKGETISDSLAAVLRKSPDWSLLPEATPPMVRVLLRRCLTREPSKRCQDAGDARLELEQAIEDPRAEFLGLTVETAPPEVKPAWMSWLPWAVAAAAVLAAFALFLMRGSDTAAPPETRSHRLTIPVPGPTAFGETRTAPPAISPDGRYVVFGVNDEYGKRHLWLRPTGDFRARQLADTEGAEHPFWSPDSAHIAFFQDNKLRRIEVSTGRIQAIGGEVSTEVRGGSWNAAGQILYSPSANTGIHLVNAAGGLESQISTPDPNVIDASHRWPHFLPDGDHYLFLFWTNELESLEEHGGVYVTSISGSDPP
ncbi:MAG: protein kinase, partial [Acidobacteriota bacterium]|nr:protein kinase [Acidobacteriota bacterium]